MCVVQVRVNGSCANAGCLLKPDLCASIKWLAALRPDWKMVWGYRICTLAAKWPPRSGSGWCSVCQPRSLAFSTQRGYGWAGKKGKAPSTVWLFSKVKRCCFHSWLKYLLFQPKKLFNQKIIFKPFMKTKEKMSNSHPLFPAEINNFWRKNIYSKALFFHLK